MVTGLCGPGLFGPEQILQKADSVAPNKKEYFELSEMIVSIHRLILRVVLRCRVERANEPSERSEPARERANATCKCPLCGIIPVAL